LVEISSLEIDKIEKNSPKVASNKILEILSDMSEVKRYQKDCISLIDIDDMSFCCEKVLRDIFQITELEETASLYT